MKKSVRQLERTVSITLIVGVATSAIFILGGVILLFTQPSSRHLWSGSYEHFTSTGYSFPHSIPHLISSVGHGQAIGYILLGVLVLLLTPILRVALSALMFIKQRDAPMAIITSVVLVILAASFIIGIIST